MRVVKSDKPKGGRSEGVKSFYQRKKKVGVRKGRGVKGKPSAVKGIDIGTQVVKCLSLRCFPVGHA